MCRRWVCLGKIIFGAHAVSKRLRIPENKILSFSDRKHSVTCRPNNLIKFLKTIAMSVPTIAEDQLFCKSNQKSIELRTKGNEKYAESQWQQALDFYNRAIFCSVSPILESVATSESGGDELALGLANRSAVLFKMGYWAECVQDIDRSIEAGYPIAKQSKLQSRRKVCDQHLSNCVKSDSIESIVEKKPTIIDCDTEVNPLTVAEQCVSIGSIVWQEEAVAVQLSESRASTHCAFCIQPLPINPFPCRKCSFYRYCDSNCAQSDWTSGHRIDCCRSNWLRSIGFAQFNCIRLAIRLCLWSWPDRSTLLTKLCLKADPPTSATNDAFEVLSQTIPDISIGNWREIQRHLQTCFDIVQQYSQSICERLASTVTLSVGGLLQQIAVIRKIEQLPLADGVFLNWAFAMANGKTTKEGNCQTQKFVGRSITIFCTINIESGQALTAKPKTASNVLYEAHDGDTDQTTRVIQEIKKDIKNGQLALYSPQSNFRTAEHLLLKCHTRLMSVMLPDDIRMIDLTLNLAICYVGLRIMDRAVNHLLRAHEAMQRSIEPNPRPELDNLALWCKSVSVTFALYEWTRKSDQKKVLVNVDQWIDAIANHVNHIKRLNRLLGISNQESGILNQCQSIAQSNVNRCKNN